MRKKIVLSFILLVMISLSGLSQNLKNAYIINNEGKKIHGIIKLTTDKVFSSEVYFKADDSISTYKKYTANDIESFQTQDGRKFKSFLIPVYSDNKPKADTYKQVFLKLEINGVASLYSLQISFRNRQYYLLKNGKLEALRNYRSKKVVGSQTLESKEKEYELMLKLLLNDCPSIKPIDVRLSQKPLHKLIKNYNECINPGSVTYEYPIKGRISYLFTFSELVLSTLTNTSYAHRISFYVDKFNPHYHNTISTQYGLSFIIINHKETYKNYDFTILNIIPFQISNYTGIGKDLNFYYQLGLGFRFGLSRETIIRIGYNDYKRTKFLLPIPFPNLAGGFKLNLSKKTNLHFEFVPSVYGLFVGAGVSF